MKKLIVLLSIVTAMLVIGCGGGGGGGSTTDGGDGGGTGINTGITGRVRSIGNGNIRDAVVKFYSNNGTLVGQATTRSDGTFAAELPTTARWFTVDKSNARFGFNPATQAPFTGDDLFGQFSFDPEEYIANDPDCLAPAPAFNTGQVVALSSDIVVTEVDMGPPPPPTGCLGD